MNLALLAPFLAVLARAVAFLHSAPALSSALLPPRVRLAAAVVLAFALAPLRPALATADLIAVLPAELLLGAAAGFAARAVIAAAETGGHLIGLQVGLGFANSFDPNLGESSNAGRRLAWCLACLAFLLAGGLQRAVLVVTTAPADAQLLVAGGEAIARHAALLLDAALRFAAPVMAAALIVNCVMALASRAAPALNVFSVMLAGALAVGGIVSIACAPLTARHLAMLGERAADAAGLGVLP